MVRYVILTAILLNFLDGEISKRVFVVGIKEIKDINDKITLANSNKSLFHLNENRLGFGKRY